MAHKPVRETDRDSLIEREREGGREREREGSLMGE